MRKQHAPIHQDVLCDGASEGGSTHDGLPGEVMQVSEYRKMESTGQGSDITNLHGAYPDEVQDERMLITLFVSKPESLNADERAFWRQEKMGLTHHTACSSARNTRKATQQEHISEAREPRTLTQDRLANTHQHPLLLQDFVHSSGLVVCV